MNEVELQIPPGSIVTTTYGYITVETVRSLVDMRGYAGTRGLNDITWDFATGNLVDKVRNEAAQNLLNGKGQWLWFIDADMVFDRKIIDTMLFTAFHERKDAQIIGGWCVLRGDPFLPTLDTGTGTWESHGIDKGVIDVMRTGGACLLVKREVFEKMAYPWFGVRPAPRPLDMLYEVDNYARQKFDLENPLTKDPSWDQLVKCATEDATRAYTQPKTASSGFGSVGEDSSFCDRAKALGFTIVVQTGAVMGHVTHKLLEPKDHGEAMKKIQRYERLACGITE